MEDYKNFLTETLVGYYQRLGEFYIHKELDARIDTLLQDLAKKIVAEMGPSLEKYLKKNIHGT